MTNNLGKKACCRNIRKEDHKEAIKERRSMGIGKDSTETKRWNFKRLTVKDYFKL